MPMTYWYAIYTRSRYEKKAYNELVARGIESYLPLVRILKQWSDRKKWVEEPLIRSYVFVKVNPLQYSVGLQAPGAVRYIVFEGKPAGIPDWQIDALKKALEQKSDFEISSQTIEAGDKVTITRGPFSSLQGELVEVKGKNRVVIRIDHIGHSLLLSIPPGALKKM